MTMMVLHATQCLVSDHSPCFCFSMLLSRDACLCTYAVGSGRDFLGCAIFLITSVIEGEKTRPVTSWPAGLQLRYVSEEAKM